MANSPLPVLGRGFYWQDLEIGQRFQKLRRTVTETNLVNFISVTGMLEATFIDAITSEGHEGPPVLAALTYWLVEGLARPIWARHKVRLNSLRES